MSTVAALAGVLALGAVLGGLLGERGHFPPVGVAKVNGGLVVYMCKGLEVGSLEVQRGNDVDGPLVWTAHKTADGDALRALPVRAKVPGYSIRVLGRLDGRLAVRAMTDNRGFNALNNHIAFRPAQLDEGSIVTEHGKTQSLASWLATSDC